MGVMQLDGEPSLIDQMINFLKNGALPVDQKEARKVKYQAS